MEHLNQSEIPPAALNRVITYFEYPGMIVAYYKGYVCWLSHQPGSYQRFAKWALAMSIEGMRVVDGLRVKL